MGSMKPKKKKKQATLWACWTAMGASSNQLHLIVEEQLDTTQEAVCGVSPPNFTGWDEDYRVMDRDRCLACCLGEARHS